MTLGDFLALSPALHDVPETLTSRTVDGLAYDSRQVRPGFLFFAFPGAKTDGRQYARAARERGAFAVVSETPRPADFDGPWIQVAHGRAALAAWSRAFYRTPDRRLTLTGMTGTNGKTTTVYLIDALLRARGRTTGMLGTIEYRVAGEVRPAVNTTPESLDLMRMFDEMAQAGATHATFEVSSHALALRRVYGIEFHTAVFSNLTRDHLDFHRTMEAYFEAKQLLFDGAGARPPHWAVINHDDEWGRKLRTHASTRRLTYGMRPGADLRAVNVETGFEGLTFDIETKEGAVRLRSPLVGHINVYNLLAAFGAGLSLGLTAEECAAGLGTLAAVPGRFERVDEGQPFLVVVDYAHTDDALRNVIQVARSLKPKRLITLFGCGGDRDRTKRPLMGEAAASLSDYVIVTSDNPRSEDPLAIINDAMVGVGRHATPHVVEPDREKAIRRALSEASAGDIVLLAGKGHETYQVLRDQTIHFDDRETARALLRGFGYAGGGAA